MNIDIRNQTAAPDPSLLTGIKYVRFPYNISNGTGITTPQTARDAANLYAPYIDRLRAAGKVPIVVLTHQTYGEGRNWRGMSPSDWQTFINEWVSFVVTHVVNRYIGKCVWQVWNEQDNGSEAAVGLEPVIYSTMLRKAWEAIKTIDSGATILTGGFVSGPGLGLQYASQMEPNWTRHCNGVATHEYGSEGATPYPGNSTGRIEPKITAWRNATGKPIWITEYGVLNNPGADYNRVVNYARDFMTAIRGRAETACWFAYGHQHNGYPVIDGAGNPRSELLAATSQGGSTTPTPQPEPPNLVRIAGLPSAGLNFRAAPAITNNVIGTVRNGDMVAVTEDVAVEDAYRWVRIWHKPTQREGWLAVRGGSWHAYTEVCQKTTL